MRVFLRLWIQVQPLVDSRVEEVSHVDSDFNPSYRLRIVDSSLRFYIVHALRLRQKT